MNQEGQQLRSVLLASKGRLCSLTVICRNSETAKAAFAEMGEPLINRLIMRNYEVRGDTIYFDDLKMIGTEQTTFCLECLVGFCAKHNARSITLMVEDGEPIEFVDEDLPLVAA